MSLTAPKTARAVRPPERDACRQQRLEVGVFLAFILARIRARVAACARNIIRRRASNPVRWSARRRLQHGQLVESTLGLSPRARCARSGQRPVRRGPHVPTGAFNGREHEARASVANVCRLRQSGKDLLSTSLSHFDLKLTNASIAIPVYQLASNDLSGARCRSQASHRASPFRS
jgi:hypothetical protein